MEIEYKFALVLILDEKPLVVLPENLTEIEKSHITLIGGKALKEHKEALKPHQGLIEVDSFPNIKFANTATATRAVEIDGTVEGRTTYFIAVSNQDELRSYVNELCEQLGIENPEPDRFFHLSLANNHGGKPFKSVGDITADDL